MTKAFFGLLSLALTLAAAPAALAQTPESQLSVGTNFVAGACLESRDADSAIVINKCNAKPQQALQYNDQNGRIAQGDKCLTAATKGEPLTVAACTDAVDGPAARS